MRHSLPVLDRFDRLDHIEIPLPCEVPWDSMTGDARVRHCGQCRQNVYNVASMTRPEALRLMESSGDRVCVRIFRRADGTILTADCRQRLHEARQRGLLVFLGVLVLVVWAHVCTQFLDLVGKRGVALAGEPVRRERSVALPREASGGAGDQSERSERRAPTKMLGKREVRALAGRIRIR
jgi:hypothetical protein